MQKANKMPQFKININQFSLYKILKINKKNWIP